MLDHSRLKIWHSINISVFRSRNEQEEYLIDNCLPSVMEIQNLFHLFSYYYSILLLFISMTAQMAKGTVTYRDGIAILQLIIFPFLAAAALFIWNRAGWKAGSKIWRYPFTLSLIRIAGSTSSLLSINHDSRSVETAVVVCALIGIAPLLLSYVGILKQM